MQNIDTECHMGKDRVRAMGRIRIRVTVGVIDGVCGVVRKKYCQKSIGIGIGNTFHQQYWYWYW